MARRSTLDGCRALVTGASSGIGAAAARLLAEAGAEVALLGRDEAALGRVGASIEARGGRARTVPVDVTDRPALGRAVELAAERMGGLDLAVVNAAAAAFGRFEEIAPEDFDRTLAVSLTGAVDTIRATLPHLRAAGGALIVTGSIVAEVPAPMFSSYVTAKSGLRGLVRTLRAELRAEAAPVDVSLVQPGVVATPFWDAVTSATGRLPRRPPAGYRAEEVARAIVACARHPRPEVTVGGQAVAQVAAYRLAGRLRDWLMIPVAKLTASGRAPADAPGALWRPPAARAEGGGRPSLLGRLRFPARAVRVGQRKAKLSRTTEPRRPPP